jgi:hypothetical protein
MKMQKNAIGLMHFLENILGASFASENFQILKFGTC